MIQETHLKNETGTPGNHLGTISYPIRGEITVINV